MRSRKARKRKMAPKKKIIISVSVILGLVLIFGIGIYGLFHYYVGLMDYRPVSSVGDVVSDIGKDDDLVDGEDSAQEEIDELEQAVLDNLNEGATELKYNENVYNILLIGTDERPGQSRGRSDTMIIFSINKETKEIVMTSLLRDIYIYIPGVGSNRLNSAYAYGGAPLLIETIETNFGIDIDKYVQVGFDSFTEIVDTIGGVYINLSDAELEYINNAMDEENQLYGLGNPYKLNGTQALQYSRIRYLDSDFGRTERQRKVVYSILAQVKSLGVMEINDLLNTLLPDVTTDLTEGELFSLVLNSATYLKYDLKSMSLPLEGTWSNLTVNGMMVLKVDFQTNKEELISKVYG